MKVFLRSLILFLALLCSSCNDSTTFEGSIGTGIDYPTRAIKIVIPFGRGGASDVFVRAFAPLFAKQLPVMVVPQNKKGAGGTLGMRHVASLASDGYTILEITPSHIIANILQRTDQTSLLRDFQPLALIQQDHFLVCAQNSAGSLSLKHLLATTDDRVITIAGISDKGLDEVTLKELARVTGKKLQFVPYKSGLAIRAALQAGEVDLCLGKFISTIKHIRSGALKPLLVLNDHRLTSVPELADVPCTVELGYPVTIKSWRGFAIRKEVPQHIRDYLVDQLRHTYNSEDYQRYATRNLAGYQHSFTSPEQFSLFLQQQFDYFSAIIQAPQ